PRWIEPGHLAHELQRKNARIPDDGAYSWRVSGQLEPLGDDFHSTGSELPDLFEAVRSLSLVGDVIEIWIIDPRKRKDVLNDGDDGVGPTLGLPVSVRGKEFLHRMILSGERSFRCEKRPQSAGIQEPPAGVAFDDLLVLLDLSDPIGISLDQR